MTNIPSTAELLRAKIATLRRKSYIEAALALGVHPARVIGKHILWLHGRGVLLVQATVGMGEAILMETSLSYLGFGVQEPTPSWGNMVALGKDYFFRGELWVSTAPAILILLTVLGFYLLGDALREPIAELEGVMTESANRREIDESILYIRDLRTYFYLPERGGFSARSTG